MLALTAIAAAAALTVAPDEVFPDLVAWYVDSSGQRVMVPVTDGVAITVPAYAAVYYDATGSRSTTVDTRGKAIALMGYRIEYGEATGATHRISGRSVDVDEGFPGWGHVYGSTGVAGTFANRLKVRSPRGGQAEINWTVTVTALPSATPVTPGSWPTIENNSVYSLDRAGDYGNLSLSGVHNVVFIATGTGPDPVLGTVNLETRGAGSDTGSTVWTGRTANVRFVGCDIAEWRSGTLGYDFCGVIGGRGIRKFAGAVIGGAMEYEWQNAVERKLYRDGPVSLSEAAARIKGNNMRRVAGLFAWNQLGEIESAGNGDTQHVIIDHGLLISIRGVRLNKNSGTNSGHTIRVYFECSSIRDSEVTCTAQTGHFIKAAASANIYADQPVLWDGIEDRWGDWDTARALYDASGGNRQAIGGFSYGPSRFFVEHVQLGSSDMASRVESYHLVGIEPQNGTAPSAGTRTNNNCWEAPYDSGIANVWDYNSSTSGLGLSGRSLCAFNVRRGSLSGAAMPVSAPASHAGRLPPEYRGPYYVSANADPRPVPA